MQLVGFTQQNDGTFKEYLPYNEQLTADVHKRAIFFAMFNAYMDKTLTFTKAEIAKSCSIEHTFRRKIVSEIDISCIKRFTPNITGTVRIDIASSLLIHAYFLDTKIPFPLPKKPFLLVGKLINLLYTPSGLSLMFDLNDMFLHLVYERIKRVNKASEILLLEDSIMIKDSRPEIPNSLIVPSYRKIDKENLFNDNSFKKQMHHAQKVLSKGEITQVYLVYPKHPNFKKYINIKLPRDNMYAKEAYQIKMTPYSFSFCAKHTRKKWQERKK